MKKVVWLAVSAFVAAAVVVSCSGEKTSGGGGGDDDDNSGGAGGGTGASGSQGSTSGMMTTSSSVGGGGPGAGGMGTGGGTPAGCNPVTNAGCDIAGGQACDANDMGNFSCFDPPNDVPLCGACNNMAGPFCMAGSTCQGDMATKCVKYCCTDADCGGSACTKGGFIEQGQLDLGVCDTVMGCTAPPVAPSGGSCVN